MADEKPTSAEILSECAETVNRASEAVEVMTARRRAFVDQALAALNAELSETPSPADSLRALRDAAMMEGSSSEWSVVSNGITRGGEERFYLRGARIGLDTFGTGTGVAILPHTANWVAAIHNAAPALLHENESLRAQLALAKEEASQRALAMGEALEALYSIAHDDDDVEHYIKGHADEWQIYMRAAFLVIKRAHEALSPMTEEIIGFSEEK